jgi:hypothetical protein
MALKINKTIGTDRGITNVGYVRIEDLQIYSKTGKLIVRPEIYQNKEAANRASQYEWREYDNKFSAVENPSRFQSKTYEIKEVYQYYLTSSVTKERDFERWEEVSHSIDTLIEDEENPGVYVTQSVLQYSSELVSGSEEYETVIPDISIITGSNVYEFAYSMLKDSLEDTFGVGTIEDV